MKNQRLLRFLIVVFALSYSLWVIEIFIPTSTSILHSYVSELASPVNPYSRIFSISDYIAGAVAIIIGIVLWVSWPAYLSDSKVSNKKASSNSREEKIRRTCFSLGFLLCGISTIGDALMPMENIQHSDFSLSDLLKINKNSGHVFTSVLAYCGFFIIIFAVYYVFFRTPEFSKNNKYIVILLRLALISTLITAATSFLFEFFGVDIVLGIWQRLSLLFLAALVTSVVFHLASSKYVPADDSRSNKKIVNTQGVE